MLHLVCSFAFLLCVFVCVCSPALSQTDTQACSSLYIHNRQRAEERGGDGNITLWIKTYPNVYIQKPPECTKKQSSSDDHAA